MFAQLWSQQSPEFIDWPLSPGYPLTTIWTHGSTLLVSDLPWMQFNVLYQLNKNPIKFSVTLSSPSLSQALALLQDIVSAVNSMLRILFHHYKLLPYFCHHLFHYYLFLILSLISIFLKIYPFLVWYSLLSSLFPLSNCCFKGTNIKPSFMSLWKIFVHMLIQTKM